MSNATQLRERMNTLLHDSAGIAWSAEEGCEALRLALDEYSRACPAVHEAVLSVESPGREISLAGLTGLRAVTRVQWGTGSAPEDTAAGFRVCWDGSTPTLVLSTFRGRLPRAGESVRVWYTRPHTIEGLDDGLETTLPVEDESLVVLGACGYAAAGAGVDRSEVLEPQNLAALSKRLLETFRLTLQLQRRFPPRVSGDPWSGGWRMDGWDG